MSVDFPTRRALVAGLATMTAMEPLVVIAHPVLPPKSADDLAVEAEILAVRRGVIDAIAARDVARLKRAYEAKQKRRKHRPSNTRVKPTAADRPGKSEAPRRRGLRADR